MTRAPLPPLSAVAPGHQDLADSRVRIGWAVCLLVAFALLVAAVMSSMWLLALPAVLIAAVIGCRAAMAVARSADHPAGDLRAVLAETTRQRDELEERLSELERRAQHDLVTGVGNRDQLVQRCSELGSGLAEAAVLLLDLDGFKEANDTLGRALGDDILRQVGERLLRCVRIQDAVVRLGGDEFVVLLPATDHWKASLTADRALDEVRKPFVVAGHSVQVRGSIGIATGRPFATLDELLEHADVAMYAAKEAGRDRSCAYDEGMRVDVAAGFRLDAEMRNSLLRGDFKVYYQPVVDAQTHRVISFEALVRWEHPDLGVLAPAEFLAAAQRSGLIVELGQLVMRTACEQVTVWRTRWPWLAIAVNVSHRELLHPEFAAQVAGLLVSTGLPGPALDVEVTETILAADEQIQEILHPLTAAGVRCSLDDFGTGHSSLGRLGRLPVDRLKIDRAFVKDITGPQSPGAPLLSSIIGLAHSLDLEVVAEGVETRAQADFLTEHGCEQLQGYLFGRALPATAIPELVDAAEARIAGAAAVVAP